MHIEEQNRKEIVVLVQSGIFGFRSPSPGSKTNKHSIILKDRNREDASGLSNKINILSIKSATVAKDGTKMQITSLLFEPARIRV